METSFLTPLAARRGFGIGAQGLALYRVVYGAFALFVVAPGHGPYARFVPLSDLPASFLHPPPGPFLLLQSPPPSWVVQCGEAALIAALVAVTVGWRTRLASVLATLLMLGLYGLLYSYGKINHNLLFILTPVVMAFSGWGAALSVDSLEDRRRFGGDTGRRPAAGPLLLLALLVGFAWFTGGFSKLIGGWLDPSSRAVQGHVIKQVVLRSRVDLLAPFAASLPTSIAWEAADWSTVAFELSALAAVVHIRVARVIASLAVLFHLGTALLMNIGAFVVLLPVYAAFADWDAVAARLRLRPLPRRAEWPMLAASLGVGAGLYLWGSPLLLLEQFSPFASDLMVTEFLLLAGASVLAVAYLVTRWPSRRRIRPPRPRS